MMKRSVIAAVVSLWVAGCSLAPHYTRPPAPIPAEWPQGPAYRQAAPQRTDQRAPIPGWRDFYGDQRLRKVIEQALENNRDLRVAASNIEKARAFYGIQGAGLFPVVTASGGATQQAVPAGMSMTNESYLSRQYSVNLGMTAWELDFFGRIRSLKDQALDQYLATEEARRNAEISLIAEVANAFLIRAADCEVLELARSTLEARQTTYRLMERRFDVGASSGLDLRQAQTLMEAARADVARYTRQVALDENALNLLAGSPVPSELLARELKAVVPPQDVRPGLSSDVLLGRPDVLQWENLLKAANANIGAARAAFFPRIALTTSLGTISPDLSNMFKAGSSTWLFAPQITLPIFDAGARRANLQVAKADRDIYLAQYEKAIQAAFRETADTLAQQGTLRDQTEAQESLVAAAEDAYKLSNARYNEGIDSYLAVLDAQRSLYVAQQGLIGLRLARLTNLVVLHQVLGGGMVATQMEGS